MSSESIAVASDHAGYELKETLKQELTNMGYEVLDLGTDDGTVSVDYPDFGYAAAGAVTSGQVDRAIIVCGTGIGISIAANRRPGIRAALCHDIETARLSREHNDANVLVLGARRSEQSIAEDCLKAFTTTPFEGGRHQRRVQKMA